MPFLTRWTKGSSRSNERKGEPFQSCAAQ